MNGGPIETTRNGRPPVADVALALCLAAISVLVAAQAGDAGSPGAETPSSWWGWALIVLPSAMVAFRRTHALVATPVAGAAQAMIWVLDLAEVFVAPLVLIFSVSACGRRGRIVGLGTSAGLVAMTVVGVVVAPDVGPELVPLAVLSCAAALILGVNTARREAEVGALAFELAVAERERDETRERAIDAERNRIAAEIHDVIGHSLSVISVRAESALRVASSRPDVPPQAIDDIATTARRALSDLRWVLQTEGEGVTRHAAPHPGLADLPAMVGQIRAGGVDVQLRWDGVDALDEIDDRITAGAYRIVQEALTNVIRHAGPGSTVRVDIDRGDSLRIDVVDDGGGPEGRVRSPAGSGLGIHGMTERARFLGGTLEAGPAPDGGFRVLAVLPLDGPR